MFKKSKKHQSKHQTAGVNPDKKYKIPFVIKKPKPIVPRRLVFVFGTCLFLIALYGVISMTLNQKSLYTHITDPTQRLQNAQIISYLNAPVFSNNNLDFLTADEQSHMSDVKVRLDRLFITYLTCMGLIIGIIAYFFAKKQFNHFDDLLARSLRGCGWTILSICFVFSSAAILGFTKFWLILHAILFPSGNWMFANDSILITLYPEYFFVSFMTRILLTFLSIGIIFLLLSWFMMKMRSHNDHYEQYSTVANKERKEHNDKK